MAIEKSKTSFQMVQTNLIHLRVVQTVNEKPHYYEGMFEWHESEQTRRDNEIALIRKIFGVEMPSTYTLCYARRHEASESIKDMSLKKLHYLAKIGKGGKINCMLIDEADYDLEEAKELLPQPQVNLP